MQKTDFCEWLKKEKFRIRPYTSISIIEYTYKLDMRFCGDISTTNIENASKILLINLSVLTSPPRTKPSRAHFPTSRFPSRTVATRLGRISALASTRRVRLSSLGGAHRSRSRAPIGLLLLPEMAVPLPPWRSPFFARGCYSSHSYSKDRPNPPSPS